MFDLEKAILQWVKSFGKHQAFDHGAIREMELHLRDHITDLISQGHSEQEAFKLAVAEFGDIRGMAQEEFQNLQRKRTVSSVMHAAMIRSFYFTGVRHFFKHKNYFLISTSGLALGIACFIMISLYVVSELSYDNFHTKLKNVYRVNTRFSNPKGSGDRATSHSPLARTMLNTYPEVAQATRVLRIGSLRIGTAGSGREHYSEDGILFADSTFFDVFDFKLIKGNPRTALVKPASLVLTETYAKKYFGDEDPIGQQITVEDDDRFFYVVTGVVADVPANSHLQFDILISLSTGEQWNDDRWIASTSVHTYVVLRDDANEKAFEKKLRDIIYKYLGPEIERYSGLTMAQWEKAGGYTGYYLIPLKNIHLYSTSTEELEPGGNISYIYMYGLIALIILFIAVFNFVNMAIAQSALRAKEVGIRKVIGSTRSGLIFQFIVESVMVSVFATVLASILVVLLKPSFTALVHKELAFSVISNYTGALALFGLAIIVGILAGSYPAFVLSAFQPTDVLKGTFNKGTRAGWIRNLLVVTQFTASIVIIISTMVVYKQLDFMLTRNLGFTKDNVLVIQRPDKLKTGQETFKNDLLTNPDIVTVAHSNTLPGKLYPERSYRVKGDDESFVFKFNHASYSFQEVMGFQLIAGRFFSKEHRLDSSAVVINEAAAKKLGFDDPIGKELTSAWHKKGELLTIIGVVKDFNIESLHKNIDPIAMELMPENSIEGGFITVRISSGENIRKTVQSIADTWSKHSNGKLFEAFFLDQDYENIYQSEFTTGNVLVVFAGLSIFIACLGLVGLLAFTATVRKKEMGIRKILGAGPGQLINLLSADVLRLIAAATVVAWPLAYVAASYWLRNFIVRIEINPWLYFLATLTVALMCAAAISFQVVKAATGNPVHSLRQE
ncbi:ABC transporter permease [Cytophagales bacterium WSM2-2]|nr:ABC transporter permease [Cytophagales bacterium WSM2-2]